MLFIKCEFLRFNGHLRGFRLFEATKIENRPERKAEYATFYLHFVVLTLSQSFMPNLNAQNLLLDGKQTNQKIRRIAYQIYENNFTEKEIVIAGISGEGFIFAQQLVSELEKIAKCKISIAEVSFDKKAKSQPDISIKSTVDTFKNKSVVIVDDVLNTGRTLAFSLRPFLSIPLKKLQVAVLVDRNHPQFPIDADYVGYALATTLNEHVQVVLSNEEKKGVYLY